MGFDVLSTILLAIFLSGCGGGGGGGNSPNGETTDDRTDLTPASETIEADTGGTIITNNGTQFEIPPGALSEDTEVTVYGSRGRT